MRRYIILLEGETVLVDADYPVIGESGELRLVC